MLEGGSSPDLSNPALWLIGAILLLAASGPVGFLFRRRPNVADRAGVSMVAGGSVLGLIAAGYSFFVPVPAIESSWWLPWGRFFIAIDGLSAAFLFPIFVVAGLASIYGLGYWPQRTHPETAAPLRIFLGLLTAAMSTLVVARDAVLFLMAFEVMTLSVFFLVTAEHEKREVRDAGWMYFAASHVSFILLLAVFNGFRLQQGSFDLLPLPAGSVGAGTKSALFLGALAAFSVKAGVMPFHIWLPAAHANAPSHVSAILSGVVIKTAIYAILRILMMLPDPPAFWGMLLLALGAVSGVAGVVYAIGQHDLKRLLAYHSIENIGIIVMGMGLAVIGRAVHQPLLVILGFSAAVLHVWNHAIFKSLLFLSAGAVIHAAGTRDIDRLGGWGRALPWTAALFTLGAAAICGLPPLNGFVSEFILYTGALRGLEMPGVGLVVVLAPILAAIGALACACFVKVVGTVFLGLARSEAGLLAQSTHTECAWSMRGPMLVLGLLCLALGIAPVLVAGVLDAAAAVWVGDAAADLPALDGSVPFGAIAIPSIALLFVAGALGWALWSSAKGSRTAGTWDCGYLRPTARMQYTGSSFASMLVGLTRFLTSVREREPVIRHPIPAPAAYRGHVDDVVLERWVRPAARWCAEQSDRLRHRQSARIQSYITYIALATLALLTLPVIDLLRRIIDR